VTGNSTDVTYVLKAKNEASNVINQVKGALQGTGTAAAGTRGAFDSLARGALAVGAAYIGMKGIRLAADMYQTGEEARRTETVFRQLARSAGGYTAVMTRMETATGNVVDRMTLQSSANRMLQIGLATTADELARMTELAVKLGGVMNPGSSAAGNIDSFISMMGKQSKEQLADFGISVTDVEVRIQQLIDTGQAMNRAEAFGQAVIDEAAESLLNLGSAAEVGETSVSRLETRWENFWSGMKIGVADTVNAFADGLEYIESVGFDEFAYFVLHGESTRPLSQVREQGYVNIQTGLQEMLRTQTAIGENPYRTPRETIDSAAAQNFSTVRYAQMLREAMVSGPGMGFAAMQNMGQYGGMTSQYGRLQGFQMLGGEQIMGGVAAQNLAQMARDIAQQAEEAKTAYGDMLSDAQLAQMNEAVKAANELANEAGRARDNFDRMNLGQIMGQQGGGRYAEIMDAVIESMPEGAARDAAARAFAMGTGQETAMSRLMDEKIAPYLARMAGINPQAALGAGQNLNTFLTQAALAGWSPQQMAQYAMPAMGYQITGGAGGQQINIPQGAVPGQIAAQYGMSVQEVLAMTGATNTRNMPFGTFTRPGTGGGIVPTEMPDAVQGLFDTMQTGIEDAQAGVGELTAALDEVDNRIVTVQIDFLANIPAWLQQILNLGGFGKAVGDSVQTNGGQPPGTTNTNKGSSSTNTIHTGAGGR